MWPEFWFSYMNSNEWKEINEWMNEWVNEWMNEWMIEWMNEWMNEWSNEWMNLLKIYLVDVHCKNPEKSLLVSISVSITVLAKIILGLESYSVIN